ILPRDTNPAASIILRGGNGLDTIFYGGSVYKRILSREPLYILDGKEVIDLHYVNPEDIERIDILKDATAITKYGEKARYGVVIITTKKVADGSNPAPPANLRQYSQADTISWSAVNRELKLSGRSRLKESDVEVRATVMKFKNYEMRVAVDGRLLDLSKDYLLVIPGDRVYTLNGVHGAEARRKYGNAKEDGVLEISTL
ncbi:MAG: TonB-dependent receptor plug domain-containing protein, partial [Bacteroidetes bacterium]|nr:TonB-dependent receptor plug domain-containing protein [Bacteroidota bacterium]